jgi:putative lipoprotein
MDMPRLQSLAMAAGSWLLTACMSDPAASQSTLSGTAMYRERMLLPADAAFEASLVDISRADAPAEVLAHTRIESPGNPPIRFTIAYNPARINAAHRYAIRARIVRGDQLLFTTDTSYPVLGPGESNRVEILLRRAGASTTAPGSATAALENTYWKLIVLGANPVQGVEPQREPHLILQREQKSVTGSGGCNRLTGSYTLDGDRITFGQMAATMMACVRGMEQEQAFHKALASGTRWQVVGRKLELFDADGKSVAQFEARN